MTKSRIVAILVSVALVLAAIIVAAIYWPEWPSRTTPAPIKLAP